MKLSTKLILSFSGVIILLLLIGVASQYFNNEIKEKVLDESQGAVQELEISGDIESYLYQSFIDAQYYLNAPYRQQLDKSLQDSLLSSKNIKREINISLQGLNFNLKKMERLIKSEDYFNFISVAEREKNLEIINHLKQRIRFYNSLMKQLMSYDKRTFSGTPPLSNANSDQDFAAAKQLLTVTIEPYYRNNLLPLVDEFKAQIRTNLDDEVDLLNRRLNRYSNILLVATIIAFLLSLLLAYRLFKSITTPLHSLSEAAEEIGHGNLEKRIEVKSDDEIGKLGRTFNRMAENLNKITFSKEYVDDIIESMRDALIVTDDSLQITRINSAACEILGYHEFELIEQPLCKIFAKGEDDLLLSAEDHVVVENYETRFKRREETTFPVNLSKAIINNKEGEVQSIVYVASDITERKKSERLIKESLKEKEMLLSEIHHRVKNNLAVISGLLQMQRWETENEAAQEVLQDSQLRVKSIALVHEKLYQSENLSSIKFDKYVKELIGGINRTFKKSGTEIKFNIDIEPIVFNVSQAIPCSLLLNELIVNVHKHAFQNTDTGKVDIKLWKESENVRLIVKDNGAGLDKDPSKKSNDSLGMSLLKTLVEQLHGELAILNNGGATFDITFALDEL